MLLSFVRSSKWSQKHCGFWALLMSSPWQLVRNSLANCHGPGSFPELATVLNPPWFSVKNISFFQAFAWCFNDSKTKLVCCCVFKNVYKSNHFLWKTPSWITISYYTLHEICESRHLIIYERHVFSDNFNYSKTTVNGTSFPNSHFVQN